MHKVKNYKFYMSNDNCNNLLRFLTKISKVFYPQERVLVHKCKNTNCQTKVPSNAHANFVCVDELFMMLKILLTCIISIIHTNISGEKVDAW